MSYLDPLRVHFAGRFLAAPPTANNDPMHFNLATFKPDFRERSTEDDAKGWWNPQGNADWRFLGCKVTSAFQRDGTPAAADDAIHRMIVADSQERVAAKMCDLDSEQQLVSEIWGLQVRICNASGQTMMQGAFDPAAFMDIWTRAPEIHNDGGACAWYQSVLRDLEWKDVSASRVLSALRESSTASGLLSIKFNLDLYDMTFGSPTFTQGRVSGTIGPAHADEPSHFVMGRQFMTTAVSGGFFTPVSGINFCVARVDDATRKVYVDVGNALTVAADGTFNDVGLLSLECAGPAPITLGDIPYLAPDWYRDTAGIAVLPADRELTDNEMRTVASNPLALTLTQPSKQPVVAIAEPPSGLWVRADRFVYRLDAGDSAEVRIAATRFGQPYGGATVTLAFDPARLQQDPPTCVPVSALTFPASVQTDARGMATVTIGSSDPGNPRGYIDGQVYAILPTLAELATVTDYPANPWNFVSVLLWSAFDTTAPPVWHGCIQPIFQLYHNLYPAMDRFLDLSNYDEVCAHREMLILAFSLDVAHPNSMPVTRELSRAKRTTILRWLTEVDASGKPALGPTPSLTGPQQ